MEHCDESTHRTLFWCRLNESGRFNVDHESVIEVRKKVSKADHESSPVYRKSYRPPGPHRAQFVQFRLQKPLVIIENQNESSPGGIWTAERSQHFLKTQRRNSIEFGSQSNSLPLIKMGMFCLSRIWVLRCRSSSRCNSRSAISDSPVSTDGLLTPVSRLSDAMFLDASASSTPLPIFPRRPSTDTLLFRRPLIEKVVPLMVDDELFEILTRSIDLKALPFKKTADSFKFYETHFPLILTKVTKDGERCTTPSKRSRTPDSPMTIMIQRQRLLNQRLVDLECMMVDMEHETEDCLFVTELHDPTFDPTKWKWNKMDVGALRRRYTIDASLREM